MKITDSLARMYFEVHVTVQTTRGIFVQPARYMYKGESDSNLNPGTKDVSVNHEVWNAANASLMFEDGTEQCAACFACTLWSRRSRYIEEPSSKISR